MSALVAVEPRGEHSKGQGRRHEPRIALQRSQSHSAEGPGDSGSLWQLLIPLSPRRLDAGRHFAVNPFRGIEHLACARHLIGAQEIGNRQEHGVSI
jgi:hypothetical protein